MKTPRAFISYSHDSLAHKKWVLELASRLRNNGIDAILDQFELKPGDDIPHFMETNLANADRILMICTEEYVDRANKGQGGVGYEKMIITSNLMKNIDENKIIPIIKQISSTIVPTFMRSKLYINLSREADYEFYYDELVRTVHNSPLFAKPPVANNPYKQIDIVKLDGDIALLHNVINGINLEYARWNYPSTKDIATRLQISRALLDVAIIKLVQLGYAKWTTVNENVILTDKGKMYAYENNILK